MNRVRWTAAWLLVVVLVVACGVTSDGELPGGSGGAGGGQSGETTAPQSTQRHMTASLRAAYIQASQRSAGPGFFVHADASWPTADNAAHGFVATFAPKGFSLTDGVAPGGAPRWEASIQVEAFGCSEVLVPLDPRAPTATDTAQPNRVEQEHGALTAWYLNGPLGLEQGFDVPEPPPCLAKDDATITVAMRVDGLSPALTPHGDVELRDERGDVVLRYHSLYVEDANGRVLEGALRADAGRIFIDVDVTDAVFPLAIDPMWSQQDKLVASNAAGSDEFGFSVALSGDTAVVGAPFHVTSGSGSAYVFVRSGTTWSQQAELIAGDAALDDEFGYAVSIDGDTAVIGARFDDDAGSASGSAYVFVRSGTTWSQEAKLSPSDGIASGLFGSAVSVSGDTAVVGSIFMGEAHVFFRTGTAWAEQAILTSAAVVASDGFGTSVSVEGDTALIGSEGDDDTAANAGAAYVFVRSGTTWSEEAKLLASDGDVADFFGGSASFSGDTALIGSRDDDDAGTASGSAYVFLRTGTTWAEQAKLVASDATALDKFGRSVSVFGDIAAVGAPSNSTTGAAYVFERVGTTWTETDKVVAGDAAAGDEFGHALSVSTDTLVVGARFDDDTATSSGSASVFALVASNGDPCGSDGECPSGFCRDGVCCDADCGGGVTSDCQSCLGAQTGGADGTCGTIQAAVSHTCRAGSGDLCDPDEVCDGTGTSCPADTVEPSTTVCNAGSGDLCDPDETCTGMAGDACPADTVEPSTTVCNAGSGDLCDPDETCTGMAGDACPADTVEPNTTTCRTGSGDLCDPDELCTGVADAACPVDVVEPATTVCNAGSGDLCDPDELCTGTMGEACPADTVEPNTTTCRTGSGDLCDPDELCTGVADAACPVDVVEPATTVCNAGSGDLCDPDELCTGTMGEACPADTVEPNTTTCRAGSGDLCDPDELCTGVADAACPVDVVEPATTVCNAGSGDLCDPDELCTGTMGEACPADTVEPNTTTCRAGSGDLCDPDELCTGVADAACPVDVVEPATTVCNAGSGDLCDPDELCTGTMGEACPADTVEPNTTTCRTGSGDLCDPDELCTGVADAACPVDVVEPATTVCNAGSGDLCDPDELCTGTMGEACPADTVEPNTTTCRAGSGDLCDPDELCTGVADAACPVDVVEPATTVCNAGSGDLCDPDELCTGTMGEACPADTVEPNTTTCRTGSGDLCDPDELCTGVADAACPVDVVEPATTVCNAGSGDLCDPDELCTGTMGEACPADTVEPNTTTCRTGSGDLCDPDELCTGVADAACPADLFEPTTTVCRVGSTDGCDPSETCVGTAGAACPSDFIEANGTLCDDGSFCNGTESCTAGVCGTSLGDPCVANVGDADIDCTESCDETVDSCTANDPVGSSCTNGTSTGMCNATGACEFAQGEACTADLQCASGNCTDGFCCDNACAGTCEACNLAGTIGVCTLIAMAEDPDDECIDGTCNGAGECDLSDGIMCTDGADCLSGFCVDGFCCDNACDGICGRCDRPGAIGTCSPTQTGTPCRATAIACDADEFCDGVSMVCPEDAVDADGTPCAGGVCEGGSCIRNEGGGDAAGGSSSSTVVGSGGMGTAVGAGGGPAPPPDPDKCSCHVVGGDSQPSPSPWLLGLGAAMILARRKRRRTDRAAPMGRRLARP